MSAWDGVRDNAEWTFFRVSWADRRIIGKYGCFTGGSVALNSLVPVKATCQLDWVGTAPDTTDAVLVRYSFDDEDGESHTIDVGTFLVTYDGDEATEDSPYLQARGTVNGRSFLSVLDDMKHGAPYTVAKGTHPVSTAVSICNQAGLSVVVSSGDEAAYTLSNAHTFDAGTSYLEVVNWCLDVAGFASAGVDPYGQIVFSKYVEPSKAAVEWSFADGEDSILGLTIKRTNDYLQSPNAVRLCYQNEDCCLSAYAVANSGCRSALLERGGRELTLYEEVTEMDGDPTTEAGRKAMGNALASECVRRLLDYCGEIDKCEWTHQLVPIVPGAVVNVRAKGYEITPSVTSMQISMTPSGQCATSGRRFVNSDVSVSSAYEWRWY